MAAMRIRTATRADVPAIVALLADDPLGAQRESLGESPSELEPYLRAFAVLDADPHQVLVVADREGVVVGTAQLSLLAGLSRRGATRAQIEGVRVAASERGSGLGTTLIEWAVGEARERGCALVQLTSDKSRVDAHRFYERLGFTATHEGFKRQL
jgi:GNAT superfamily N-acetyltransferase